MTDETSFSHVARLRQFKLPGGEKAIQEPRRAAVGLLFEMFGEQMFERADMHPLNTFAPAELLLLRQMLVNNINSPLTSSAGRLFDAVASLTTVRGVAKYEGQAAMELEWAIGKTITTDTYSFTIHSSELPMIIDWEPMIVSLREEVRRGVSPALISAKFHNSLTEIIIEIAKRIGEKRVVLTGGCFQNKYLLERSVIRLEEEGFRPYWHQRVPPNDGGIALGQIYAAQRMMRAKSRTTVETMFTESII